MTVFFHNRVEGGYKRYNHVKEIKFGIESVDGKLTNVTHVFFENEAISLKQDEYLPILVHGE